MRRTGTVLMGLTVVASIAAGGTATATPVSSYEFASTKGDSIGEGASGSYRAPVDKFRITGSSEFLTVTVDTPTGAWWVVDLAAARGQRLRPGVYLGAQRAPFREGEAPGLAVSNTGRGCNRVWGEFEILRIEENTQGAVTELEATFTQHCESPTAPPLKGTLHYHA
ncbi:hypothetical protein GCM10022247_51860 [Allokutzneria multivorans]|uniref:Uncharacterized protein n=1 Tax=Allokutzneria multivorans TaxID=1142134 RepID=A0ABP7T5D2_9PSEU